MPRPDEGLIHAWLDGELDAAESARVERLVAEDAAWAAAAAEARGVIAASSRILGQLDVVAGDVIPGGGTAAPALGGAARVRVPAWMRMAAGFVLVAGVAYLGRDAVQRDSAGPERVDQAVMATEAAPVEGAAGVADAARAVDAAATSPAAGTAAVPASVAPPTAKVAEQASAAAVPAAPSPAAPPAPALQAPQAAEPRRELRRDARLDQVVVTGVTGVTSDSAPARRAFTAELERSRAAQDARAKGAAALAAPSAMRAQAEPTAPALVVGGVLDGCWLVRSAVRVDSIQVAPRILRLAGDTLEVALTPARLGLRARVVRDSGEALVGEVRHATGAGGAFFAARTDCP